MRLILAAYLTLTGMVPPIFADSDGVDLEWSQPHGPSYDCRETQNAADLAVCDDPLLSRLDRELNTAYDAAIKRSAAKAAILEEQQQRWLHERHDECQLGFDYHAQIDARLEATSCLITSYVKRIVEIGDERRVLDALVDFGIVELRSMEFDLGSVRINLPRVLPMTRNVATKLATPHPACIHKLLRSSSTKLSRAACRDGTDHLPAYTGIFHSNDDGVSYVKWGPHRLDQRADLFGYRQIVNPSHGRTLIHVFDQSTGAGRTTTWSAIAVVSGFMDGDTIAVEQLIRDDGMSAFCGGGIDDISVVGSRTLRISNYVSVETLVTLFEWFPEQLDRISEEDRRRLLAMANEGDFFVPMSIISASCIGTVHYHYDLETGSRDMTEVSLKVTQADREALYGFPMISCLFGMLNGLLPKITMRLRPTDLEAMIVHFVETCGVREP